MTSAPSRRQPSNGNNLPATHFWILLFFITLSSGCELFKPIDSGGTSTTDRDRPDDRVLVEEPKELDPIQSRRVYDPATGTYIYVQNAPTQKMDTVKWRLISEVENPPITEEGTDVFTPNVPVDPTATGNGGTTTPISQTGTSNNGSRLLTAYNVNFILPFLANRLDRGGENSSPKIDANSLWSLHFYSGAQMALDDLRNRNINLNVSAQDTKATLERVKQLELTPAVKDAHLLIGPYLRNNVIELAENVRGKEQVIISPYSAAGGLSADNPNYIQVNPTLETHCRNILRHAVTTQGGAEIVLVAPSEQAERFAVFQEEYKILRNDVNVTPLTELTVDNNSANLTPYLRGRNVVFIVPVYDDESFVANFLRKAFDASRQQNADLTVYGLPQWKTFTRIDFDYYEGCNVHISSSVFVDLLDADVSEFRKDFYDRFKALPREEAYVGYDITHYFARMIQQYGTRFQYDLPRSPEKLLHTEFRFEPMMVPRADGSLENPRVDHWENTYVNILRFQDYQFKKVN